MFILLPVGLFCALSAVYQRELDRQPAPRLAGPAPRMSRDTPFSISSESDSPIAFTITSASGSTQTISSDHNPDVAPVSGIITVLEEDADQRSDTIEHVDSESDDLEVLEAEVETARAKREEREALERLAKARRVRGSNASARSVRSSRSVRSAISSENFGAPQVSNVQTSQSAPRDPPALLASTATENQPELPTGQSCWLEWFATHAPRKNARFLVKKLR